MYGVDCPCPRATQPTPTPRSRSRALSSVGFFTAAGGVYHSLVRRLWCRWFILNKLLSQKKILPLSARCAYRGGTKG
jgi:hypothetical protein